MNLHITVPDERAKEFDAACASRKESREQFAERVLLAALRAPKEVKAVEVAPEKPAEAPPKDSKKSGGQ